MMTIDTQHTDHKHLMNNAKLYNDEFSFGVLTTNKESLQGLQVVKINNQITYELMGINQYNNHNKDKTQPFKPLAQSFCLDPMDAFKRRAEINNLRTKKLRVILLLSKIYFNNI